MTSARSPKCRREDDDVRERAVKDDRLLITDNKDFGQLVYADMRSMGGVIFIRYPARARRNLTEAVVEVIKQLACPERSRKVPMVRLGRDDWRVEVPAKFGLTGTLPPRASRGAKRKITYPICDAP